jgi:hypothetical protein
MKSSSFIFCASFFEKKLYEAILLLTDNQPHHNDNVTYYTASPLTS